MQRVYSWVDHYGVAVSVPFAGSVSGGVYTYEDTKNGLLDFGFYYSYTASAEAVAAASSSSGDSFAGPMIGPTTASELANVARNGFDLKLGVSVVGGTTIGNLDNFTGYSINTGASLGVGATLSNSLYNDGTPFDYFNMKAGTSLSVEFGVAAGIQFNVTDTSAISVTATFEDLVAGLASIAGFEFLPRTPGQYLVNGVKFGQPMIDAPILQFDPFAAYGATSIDPSSTFGPDPFNSATVYPGAGNVWSGNGWSGDAWDVPGTSLTYGSDFSGGSSSSYDLFDVFGGQGVYDTGSINQLTTYGTDPSNAWASASDWSRDPVMGAGFDWTATDVAGVGFDSGSNYYSGGYTSDATQSYTPYETTNTVFARRAVAKRNAPSSRRARAQGSGTKRWARAVQILKAAA